MKLDFVALRRIVVFVLIITGFSLIPFGTRTKLTYIIKNNSKKTIVLRNKVTNDTIVLEPESFFFDSDIKETGFNYIKDDLYKNKNICSCYGDSFDIISVDTTFKIIKRIDGVSDWEHLEEENLFDQGGVFVCRFLIKDKDFYRISK